MRPAYFAELALGTDRFHTPRRADCPWCGADRLRTRLRTGDLAQRKPGIFVLDQCRRCGHCFQNPGLTPEGLDFYDRDLHDGLRSATARRVLAARRDPRRHRAAARVVLPFGEPESWLDVGTGDALFPTAARGVHPYTAFDGIDGGPGAVLAASAGLLDEGYRGALPEFTGRLRARYDVLSMFHHLERVADPRAELAAAHTVLRPGGHLLLETPDPGSLGAVLLGRWWAPYLQPRRLHLLPPRNLRRELERLGFTVLSVERAPAHVPGDLGAALGLALGAVIPAADAPWLRAPGAGQRLTRAGLLPLAGVLLTLAYAVDVLLAPAVRRTRLANAYRVVARRD